MALTKEEVLNVAKLARLKFKPEEIEKFQVELNDILGYIDMLNEVDIQDKKPLVQVNGGSNNLREDKVRESLSVEKALKNAPDSGDGAVKDLGMGLVEPGGLRTQGWISVPR